MEQQQLRGYYRSLSSSTKQTTTTTRKRLRKRKWKQQLQPTTIPNQQQQTLEVDETRNNNHGQPNDAANNNNKHTFFLSQLALDNTSLFNLDNVTLLKEEETVISLGLKFIPQRSATNNKIRESLSSSLNTFRRRLLLETFFHDPYKIQSAIPKLDDNNWIPPPSDPVYSECVSSINKFIDASVQKVQQLTFHSTLTSLEKFISDTLTQIKNKPGIIIKAADKNLGTCILTTSTYNKYCLDILQDVKTYKPIIIDDIFKSLHPNNLPFIKEGYARLRMILNSHKQLWRQHNQYFNRNNRVLTTLAKSLLQLSDSNKLRATGKFYILLKMHKPVISGRPIVSCIGTLTYHASKYIDNLLKPIIPLLSTVTTSSISTMIAIDKFNDAQQHKDSHNNNNSCCIYCADVKNLYPSIPIELGLQAIEEELTRFHFHDIDLILDILKWILTHNYLHFEDQIYLQVSGTAMGTPCAPSYANIVLYHLEQQILKTIEPPLFYKRYLDDIFAIFATTQQAESFTPAFNALVPAIQLDAVTIGNSGVFLDMNLSILQQQQQNNGSSVKINVSLYQKPSNKYLYLPPTTAHAKHIIENFITNELYRYRLYNMLDTDFDTCKQNFYNRLKARGYTSRYLIHFFGKRFPSRDTLLKTIIQSREDNILNNINDNNNKKKKRSPIIILNLPKLHNSQQVPFMKTLFTLPPQLLSHPLFKQAYPGHLSSRPTIARRLGKNIQRLIATNEQQEQLGTPQNNNEE